MRDTIICGDTLEVLKTLPDGLVDCVVTSPPYWGLRDYGADGQLGLEPTLREYIDKMVAVFREVRRVLKDTGTAWINMGDGYVGTHTTYEGKQKKWQHGEYPGRLEVGQPQHGLKTKDLIGQPWRLAFALQADGWYLRSDIIWAKPNPMPESVTDRPTKSHEYIFLMSKKAKYFYDADAVREEQKKETRYAKTFRHGKYINNATFKNDGYMGPGEDYEELSGHYGRNKRTVWTVATQPFPEAHFATFPEKLIEPCIRAGTSEKGYCAECGKPWVRMVEKSRTFESGSGKSGNMPSGKNGPALQGGGETLDIRRGPVVQTETLGWQPSCSCGADTISGLVLDPFMGSGTVALVAVKLGRNYLGIELSPEYVDMANNRLREKMGLFA